MLINLIQAVLATQEIDRFNMDFFLFIKFIFEILFRWKKYRKYVNKIITTYGNH